MSKWKQSRRSSTQSDYEPWLRKWFPAYVSTLSGNPISLADHHHEFWQWVWSLKRGTRPSPFVAIWPRGGGKSTSAELACVAVGARRSRRYVLYVSATQAQADDHVSNVASLLESASVEQLDPALADRMVGKYGSSRGWRRNRLRTAAGFTVDAIGLDVAARGVKLDEARPDLLVLDDIDDAVDSQETTRKKIVAITQKLLPAGSTDAGTLAVQNLVHHEGVFAKLAGLASEATDFLADRIVSGPHPALKGMTVEKQSDGKWLILTGEPTWDGQNRETCQRQINDWGLRAFRSEAQHEKTPPEGQAFPEFDASVHVCEPFKIPDNWPRWRAVDYGYAVPYTCLWAARSPAGRIYVYRETYGTRLTAADQAYQIRLASAGEKFFVSVGDPAMWASQREGQRFQSVADQYGEMGVALTPATNERLSGKALVHRAFEWGTDAPPVVQIFKTCHNLVRTIPLLPVDPHKPEDVDCWVAGTQISTPTGPRVIEDVRVGDLVETPIGPRAVLQSYASGESETTIVTLSDGRVLEGTPDHEIYIEGKGLVPLESLVCYDIPIGRNTWSRPLSIGVLSIGAMRGACTTTRMAASSLKAGLVSIVKFGLTQVERFLPGGMSTTLMATMTTTPLRTSSASHPESTASITMNVESTAISAPRCPHGGQARKGKRYSATMHGRCWSACRHGSVRADIVAWLLKRRGFSRSTVLSRAKTSWVGDKSGPIALCAAKLFGHAATRLSKPKPAHIVAVGHSGVKKTVYSISVADAHLFYANDVLSSNTTTEDHSYDGLRYLLQAAHWLDGAKRQKPQVYSVGGRKGR